MGERTKPHPHPVQEVTALGVVLRIGLPDELIVLDSPLALVGRLRCAVLNTANAPFRNCHFLHTRGLSLTSNILTSVTSLSDSRTGIPQEHIKSTGDVLHV